MELLGTCCAYLLGGAGLPRECSINPPTLAKQIWGYGYDGVVHDSSVLRPVVDLVIGTVTVSLYKRKCIFVGEGRAVLPVLGGKRVDGGGRRVQPRRLRFRVLSVSARTRAAAGQVR
jgi:hypothetical protein